MAGVAFPGTLGPPLEIPPSLQLDFKFPTSSSENNSGIPPVFNQWINNPPTRQPNIGDDAGTGTPAFPGGGVVTVDQEGTPGVRNIVAFPGNANFDVCHFNAQDWYEQIHILPKSKIEYGNIITLVQETYEIYNAFRKSESTENAITNNALPGIDLPNNTPAEVLPRLTSFLDPTTTGQTALGLGTMVLLNINALANGLPSFDTDVIFEFTPPANDVFLLISGSRIVLVALGGGSDYGGYESPARESLGFLTDIIPALDGNEQRIALRQEPRQEFQVEFDLSDVDRQAMHALLFDWQANVFGFPVWHERVLLTGETLVGATQYPVTGADDVDFRLGGLAAAISDRNTFDVIEIIAKTDTLITAGSPALNAYPVGTPIIPVRICVLPQRVQAQRLLNNQENFKMVFEVIDNVTGAPTGDVAPGFWDTYNGRVLFDDCNVMRGSNMNTKLSRRIYRADGKTGLIEQTTIWDRNKRESQKGFFARSREEILALRKLFIGLVGRQKAFYIPTFAEELTVNATLGIGSATMDIDNIGYVRFVADRLPMSIFRITFTDNTTLIRNVLSSVIVSGTTERLTLDVIWPATRPIDEIARIEWFELVRFDSDEMTLTYPRIGQATTRMPVVRVFDDNV